MGVTIRFGYSCEEKYKLFVDSVLSRIVKKLNRQDTTLQILVIVNDSYLTYYKSPHQYFISLGYDTLREIDTRFIYEYYNPTDVGSGHKFQNRYEPLDINATFLDTANTLGIKIIYTLDYTSDYKFGEPDWNLVEKLISYSVNNLEAIKNNQTRNNVLYGFKRYWYVSLMSLDTLSIQSIIDHNTIYKHPKSSSRFKYLLIFFAILIFISIFFVWRKKYSS